jgi:uncharacterized membrane protein
MASASWIRAGEMRMADRPVVMAVASYRSKAAAESDFRALWAAEAEAGPCRVAAALVEKGADGQLTIDRHRCPADHPAWNGPVLGSALTVVAAPVGIRFLVPVVDTGPDLGGVGAIAGHFWNNVPKHQLRQMSELLETSQAALVVVAGDTPPEAVLARLAGADDTVFARTSADFDHDYSSGVEEARTIG